MTPIIIHYCWFGGSPMPKKFINYINSWQKISEQVEIMRWDESNSPMNLPYMQNALVHKKWANLSNFTRLYALHQYGGIYLDVDIEVLRPFQDPITDNCFLGFEDPFVDWDGCVNNAVIGAEKNHWFIKEMIDNVLEHFDGTEEAHLSSPNMTTTLLKRHGLKKYGEQYIKDIHIYPTETFYPYSWHTYFRPEQVTKKTLTIHWFEGSWSDKRSAGNLKEKIKRKYHLFRWKFLKYLHKD